ncbi:MAG TPA: DUF2889 domain-containing protein [Blastocatellia bacterium]|nr:DUF2889 domain-containing protein [Blastocatellia bacterium]
MAIEFSIPLSHSNYLRTFAAEIDVLAENVLLVRGSMRDHRFAFEHVWRLRTPEYEIIEAGARQIEGEFDPRLCERYAGVKGARIGRGFSKRVLSALGDSAGAQEHLLTAIEMARVGQQVYQYTPEFEAQFPSASGDSTEAARITWLKDRAYMGLANTCYTYRDESESLFSNREVRCGFGAELTRPKPGDKRVFWRNKRLAIELKSGENGGTVYACESAMEDSIHDIRIGFDRSSDGLVSNASSNGARLPYHGICEDPHLRTHALNGLKVTGAFLGQFAEHVGGAQGCAHVFDLSIDCLRLFTFKGLMT